MNTKKTVSTTAHNSRAKGVSAAAKRRSRPVHKRIMLHPFSIMILLCVGVIITGSTLQSFAATFDVTATVSAPVSSAPAFITSPYHQQHTPQSLVQVAGSCPGQSYVKLYRKNTFSGVAQCQGNAFQIQTNLEPGENQLQARVFNTTNDEGPTSPPITVYFDYTAIEPSRPSQPPTTITVSTVEQQTYRSTSAASQQPTITGFAPPFAEVTVTFYSDPVVCKTKADGVGWWSCTLHTPLPQGRHRVEIAAVTPQGAKMTFPTFHIIVGSTAPLLMRAAPEGPLRIMADYRYQARHRGEAFSWSLSVNGGTSPYKLAIDWGDESQTVLTSDAGTRLTITHAFPEAITYHPIVRVTDDKGAVAALQLLAVVPGLAAAVQATPDDNQLTAYLSQLRQYLWIVWPVYGAVVLMVLSFWLGELEVIRRFSARQQSSHGKTSKGRPTRT